MLLCLSVLLFSFFFVIFVFLCLLIFCAFFPLEAVGERTQRGMQLAAQVIRRMIVTHVPTPPNLADTHPTPLQPLVSTIPAVVEISEKLRSVHTAHLREFAWDLWDFVCVFVVVLVV